MNSKDLEPKAEKALTFLHEKAAEHAIARATADYMDSWLKTEKARLKGLSTATSNAAQEDEAMRHADYLAAIEAKREADALHYTNMFKREAASAIVEAWRTVCSNERRLP